ncbi:hypothetical protein [Weissella viridescens]|uniref:hypothetical protein n=1 Tax=Weissella viridescens TaxID=1629 RepID=UPI003AF21633
MLLQRVYQRKSWDAKVLHTPRKTDQNVAKAFATLDAYIENHPEFMRQDGVLQIQNLCIPAPDDINTFVE